MTERGAEIRKVIRATVRKLEAEWAKELGAEELEQLRSLLIKLGAVVAKASREAG